MVRLGYVSTDPLTPEADSLVPGVESSANSVPAAIDRMLFRRVTGRFATGICVVSTSFDGIDHAMTVSAFNSVSLEPLLVMVCVEKITRFHEAVLQSGAWAVSVLGEDAEPLSRWFAEKGRPTHAQMADHRHHPGPVTGMPVLEAAIAVIECRTWAVYDGGDHDVVLGEVVGVSADPDPRGPLLYVEGRYRRLAD
jgi:flavin reductase (DIM6/NTAB) family NADH-FMN oxidoreductase RutF